MEDYNYSRENVHLLAPGVGILSCESNTGGYVAYSGTSMAVPHVVGTAALIKSVRPDMTDPEIKECILSTVTPGYEWSASSGGVLNAEAALKSTGAESTG